MMVGEYAARYGAYAWLALVSTKIALLTELGADTGAVPNRPSSGAARGHRGRAGRKKQENVLRDRGPPQERAGARGRRSAPSLTWGGALRGHGGRAGRSKKYAAVAAVPGGGREAG